MEKKVSRFRVALKVIAVVVSLSSCSGHARSPATVPAKATAKETAKAPAGKESLSPDASAPRAARSKSSLGDIFAILSGSLAWSRHDWAMAASSFLDAERAAIDGKNSLVRQYAVYGLASTYLAQDEYEAALSRLSELDENSSPAIGSGIWYQAGIVAFRKGEYADASAMFRKSLEYDSSRTDAKINLELSRRSLSETEAKRNASGSSFSGSISGDDDADTVFTLVRKKEQDRWKNQEEQTSRENVADY
jgi:Ca-activated chloride channel family protein